LRDRVNLHPVSLSKGRHRTVHFPLQRMFVLLRFIMSKFPQFDTAKIMIAASVRHCRLTLEELPVGQIVVDEFGLIRSIDQSTMIVLGVETAHGAGLKQFVSQQSKQFPEQLSPANFGDMGEFQFLGRDNTLLSAHIVCVPDHHPQTFLLSIVFSSRG
jgi:hypothetical protein